MFNQSLYDTSNIGTMDYDVYVSTEPSEAMVTAYGSATDIDVFINTYFNKPETNGEFAGKLNILTRDSPLVTSEDAQAEKTNDANTHVLDKNLTNSFTMVSLNKETLNLLTSLFGRTCAFLYVSRKNGKFMSNLITEASAGYSHSFQSGTAWKVTIKAIRTETRVNEYLKIKDGVLS